MTIFRNRLFLEGIALGGICGLIIGSVLALTLGESSIEAVRNLISRISERQRRVPFEYLSQ